MAEEYPAGAFAITLIGAIFALLAGIIPLMLGAGIMELSSILPIPALGAIGALCVIISLLGALLGFIGAALMRNPEKARTGGALAIIAAFFSVGGLLSFILLLIGGILALTWKKPEKKPVIVPPPPPVSESSYYPHPQSPPHYSQPPPAPQQPVQAQQMQNKSIEQDKDIKVQLQKLKELKDEGLITEEDYERKKEELLKKLI